MIAPQSVTVPCAHNVNSIRTNLYLSEQHEPRNERTHSIRPFLCRACHQTHEESPTTRLSVKFSPGVCANLMQSYLEVRIYFIYLSWRVWRFIILTAGGVGKSALTIRFGKNLFIEQYDPTIEGMFCRSKSTSLFPLNSYLIDEYRREVNIDDQRSVVCVTLCYVSISDLFSYRSSDPQLDIVDTAGAEQFTGINEKYIQVHSFNSMLIVTLVTDRDFFAIPSVWTRILTCLQVKKSIQSSTVFIWNL